MPQMTYRQWDEYKAIIKRCNELEIERRSSRALAAQVEKLKAQVDQLTGQVMDTINERDAARLALQASQAQVSVITAELEQTQAYSAKVLEIGRSYQSQCAKAADEMQSLFKGLDAARLSENALRGVMLTIMSWDWVQSYRWAEDDDYSRTLIHAEKLIAASLAVTPQE